jgi:hypothetical protein
MRGVAVAPQSALLVWLFLVRVGAWHTATGTRRTLSDQFDGRQDVLRRDDPAIQKPTFVRTRPATVPVSVVTSAVCG